VAYTPDWEPLADALKRVTAAGASEGEGKIDLCRAIADKKIAVRVRIAASDTKGGSSFTGRNIRVPPHLTPADFDWTHSKPVRPWSIGPAPGQHYSWIEDWKSRPIDLIELSTDDVAKVLSSAASNDTTSQYARPNSKSGGGAKSIGIEEAIYQLWPNGIPKGLSAKERDNKIYSKMKENGSSLPRDLARAIQRVLERRK
jgi:hypothetical protein